MENFCAAILILKMEGKCNIFDMLCFMYSMSKSTNATELPKREDCTVYRDRAVPDQTCQKWFAKFLGAIYSLAK